MLRMEKILISFGNTGKLRASRQELNLFGPEWMARKELICDQALRSNRLTENN